MKVLIKKDFAGYVKGQFIEFDETKKEHYTDVVYWLRRCEDGKIDGFCELVEFNTNGKKNEKNENVIQSEITDEKKVANNNKKRYTVTKE